MQQQQHHWQPSHKRKCENKKEDIFLFHLKCDCDFGCFCSINGSLINSWIIKWFLCFRCVAAAKHPFDCSEACVFVLCDRCSFSWHLLSNERSLNSARKRCIGRAVDLACITHNNNKSSSNQKYSSYGIRRCQLVKFNTHMLRHESTDFVFVIVTFTLFINGVCDVVCVCVCSARLEAAAAYGIRNEHILALLSPIEETVRDTSACALVFVFYFLGRRTSRLKQAKMWSSVWCCCVNGALFTVRDRYIRHRLGARKSLHLRRKFRRIDQIIAKLRENFLVRNSRCWHDMELRWNVKCRNDVYFVLITNNTLSQPFTRDEHFVWRFCHCIAKVWKICDDTIAAHTHTPHTKCVECGENVRRMLQLERNAQRSATQCHKRTEKMCETKWHQEICLRMVWKTARNPKKQHTKS